MPTAAVNLAAAQLSPKTVKSVPPPESDRSEAFEQALDDARRREGRPGEKTAGAAAKDKSRPAAKKAKPSQPQAEEPAVGEGATGEQVESSQEQTPGETPTAQQPEDGAPQDAVSDEEGTVRATAGNEKGQFDQVLVVSQGAVPQVDAAEAAGDESELQIADVVDCSTKPAASGVLTAVAAELPEPASTAQPDEVTQSSAVTAAPSPQAKTSGSQPVLRAQGDGTNPSAEASSQPTPANPDQGAIRLDAETPPVADAVNIEAPEIRPTTPDSADHKIGAQGDTDKASIGAGDTLKAAPPRSQGFAPAVSAEEHFVRANHDPIVTGVRAQLVPHGGSMQIRLDPPELGALQVMVEMREGVMTATFQTSSDEATRLLSHSLNHLKHVLESQGVNVEKLQVQQAPKNEQSNAGEEQNQQQQSRSDEHAARQEQQRKELLRRMWRKVSGLSDPLDLVA